MPRKTFAETMQSWKQMLSESRTLLAELPELADLHAELARLLAEAQKQSDRVKKLGAQRRVAARLCKEAVAAGTEVRLRLRGGLVHRFGPKNEQLIAFGLKPRPRKIRRRTHAEMERDARAKKAAAASAKG